MSATPRPWYVQKILIRGQEHADFFIKQAPGVSLLQMNGPCLMYANAEIDADLIVRAVNAFDALLDVVRAFDDRGVLDDWHLRTLEAVVKLDTAHPDWREWTP